MRDTGRWGQATEKTSFHKLVGPNPHGATRRSVLYMIVESMNNIGDGRHVRFWRPLRKIACKTPINFG
jgi:hypothetical protein